MNEEFKFGTIEQAIEDIKNGKMVLVTDDEDRENEGDFICAAEFATTENINFMAMHAKGLICMPMSAEYVKKLHKLRIFSDEEGKINRSIEDVGGEVLVVSQFTLYADCKKGNRPSFTQAGSPAEAERLYEYFLEECRKEFGKVEHGIFGAEMKVSLENDGPFTVIWDSREW